MQNGRAKVDLAVLLGIDSSFNMPGGNSMQILLDKGYSYNLLSEALLRLDSAEVQNGLLCPSGPAYKAMIVKEAKILSAMGMQTLLEYARNGLPVIFYNCDIKRIYGTNRDDNNDKLLQEKLAELMKMDRVKAAGTQEEILSILSGWRINPSASYEAPGLEASHRAAMEGNYYYFYNNSQSPLETTVALTGHGAPYRLDAWTGSVVPLALYQQAEGRTLVGIKLEPREAAIIAISEDTSRFPTVKDVYVTESGGADAVYAGGSVMHRAGKPGTYAVSLSDNKEKTVTLDAVPKTINLMDGWDLSLESWGPDPAVNKVDPTLSVKKTITFEDIPLSVWSNLPASKEQLKTLGVGSMSNVSGIGTYSTTFITLPSDWNSNTGAYMHFEHGADMVVEVVLNDHLIDDVNQLTNTVDAGAYVTTGRNTLMVKLDTTLKHRKDLESPGDSGPMGAPQGGMPDGSGGGAPGAGGMPGGSMGPEAATGGRGGGEGMGLPQGGMPEGTRGTGGRGMGSEPAMGGGGAPAMPGGMGSSSTEPETYGLTAVTLIPYVQTVLVQ
jgi:hypothetical protein